MLIARRVLLLTFVSALSFSMTGCGRGSTDSQEETGGAKTPYNGTLDGFVKGEIVGWAYDYGHKDDSVTVDIYDGEEKLGSVKADKLRKDLAEKKIGTGKYGFQFAIPASLKDGKTHEIRAKIKDTTFELNKSPRKTSLK
jgi:hypothetical protein